jgi:hypothetical protein
MEGEILGFGVQLEGRGLLQMEVGWENDCSMLKYLHKALWKNTDQKY